MGNCLKPLKKQNILISPKPLTIPPISEEENLRVFSYEELRKATKNFGQVMTICDETCGRKYYKAYLNETTFAPSRTETAIAVSVMDCSEDNPQTLLKWEKEVKSLGKFSHPNLVKHFGYCPEPNKPLLVFEYLSNGSLDRYIFGKEEEKALKWEIRVKIAIGVAQGLAFLHSNKKITLYREFGMHDILLDEQYNAKLLYFGSNEVCKFDKDNTRQFVYMSHYVPPEYVMTGHLDEKSNVYTLGVILLEMLSGSSASGGVEIENKQRIHDLFKPFLSGKSKLIEIIDPRLGDDYPVNAVTQMGKLIRRCMKKDSMKRPKMQQVLDSLSEIAEIKD